MDALKQFFIQVGFKVQDAEIIANAFTYIKLSKGEFFAKEGKISKQLGLIENGFLQYYILLNGEEKTTYSSGANTFVASLVSFLKQVPAKENIRAVTETTLWVIDRTQLKQLQIDLPGFKDFYIEALEEHICCIDESRLDAIMLNAQQRYEKILAKEPTLVQHIPMHFLASILGVTPRHLSRIRNNIR
ncbi:MAG: Crp/Fnr family transcriptional regulator [Saprospiraceae bacterium]|nr:Crp/Fnr family transcriptional regulator [Saprospiraceae bacterium]